MGSRPLSAGLDARHARRLVAIGAVALALGGCFGRNPADTTGSIGSVKAPASQANVSELAARYERNQNDPAIAVAYAAALRANGQHAQAVAVLQQAAIRQPKSMPVLAAYGKALADAGRLKEAADVLSRAHTPERPDWRILSVQGTIADQLGDFDGAQRYYEAALRLVPGEPTVLSNQGLSFALTKRLPQAEQILRQAAANPRADARVRQNLALVLGLEGKFGDAEEVLKRDLPPAEVASALATIRSMASQPNNLNAIHRAQASRRLPAEAQPKTASVQPRPSIPVLKEAELRR
jgi:Flp pilus assembly protein TadD